GWTNSGVRVVIYQWLVKRERVSVFPAYMIKGYIHSITFSDICIVDIFEDFIIDKLLPLYNLYPGPRLVIIIDNISVY
ncbi:hypothetical protein NA56DRAFT_555075, partial [Hyaloscypha hepaticicola]